MGRMYSVEFASIEVSALQDLFELTPADDKPISLHALYIGQSSDVGDAEEEIYQFKVIRGNATSGSGGGTSTPAPMNPIDTAAGFTCEVNNTTEASTGTEVDCHSDTFNIRTGLQHIWTPETRPICTQVQSLIVVRLLTAPGDAVTMTGTLYVEELA